LLEVALPGGEIENLHDAFADLAAYSLATRDAEGPFFLIHRLVQDVTRRSFDEKDRKRSIGEALNWIDDAFAGDPADVRNWPRLEPLVPHALTIVGRADAAGIAAPTARLMNQAALLLKTKALHGEAEPLMRRALAIFGKSLGPDHPRTETVRDNYALLLRAMGKSEAEIQAAIEAVLNGPPSAPHP
jgi:hypothetical protein